MAVDFLLKIETIKGESPVEGFKDYMQIESFSWGASQTGTFQYGSGGSGGKCNFQDFSFMMRTNSASPQLMEKCAAGYHIPKATLICRKASGGTAITYLKVEFTDVIISSYTTGGSSGDEVPLDSISLNFAKILFEYTEQTSQGGKGATTPGSWDLKKLKK